MRLYLAATTLVAATGCSSSAAQSRTCAQLTGRHARMTMVATTRCTTLSQAYALVRSGDLVGIQIGGRGQWRVERIKLEEYIQSAYRRTAAALAHLPDAPLTLTENLRPIVAQAEPVTPPGAVDLLGLFPAGLPKGLTANSSATADSGMNLAVAGGCLS